MAGWRFFQNKLNQKFFTFLWVLSIVVEHVTANNPPTLVNFDGVLIHKENISVGSILGNITAVDTDGPKPLTFSISNQETKDLVKLSEPRIVEPNTSVVDIILLKPLDREREAQKKLSFVVSDSTSTISATVIIYIRDVNDVHPEFKNLPYKATVNESVSPNSVVFTGVHADDPDSGPGGAVSYSMETDAQGADEDYKTTFEINPISGIITVKKPLNYEKHNFYKFKINARDGLGLEAIGVDFVVTVLDVQDTPPYFVNLPYSAEVNESVDIGTQVLQVSGLDGDRGVPNNLTYSFLKGDFENFNIDSKTGVITVKKQLDRDSPDVRNRGGVYAMYVQASEIIPPNQVNDGQTSASTLVTITVDDVNDNAPEFDRPNYNATILENMQKGVPVTFFSDVMRVFDRDQGTNSHFQLSVEQNGQPFYDFAPLPQEVYSESTILLRVNNSTNLNYEKNPQIIFQVVAREVDTAEKRSSTATVSVYVEDMNDNSPVFPQESYNLTVKENTPVNSTIGAVKATDSDEGTNGQITYSLRGGNDRFGIQQTGNIYVAAELDREETDEYYLTAEAQDGGGLRTPVEVKIIVEDMNDKPPIFRRQEYEAILRESDTDFLRPLFVEASDDDLANTPNSQVKYRILETPQNLENNFTINSDTGRISVVTPIDYEKLDKSLKGVVNMKVEAFDQGKPSLKTTVNVTIVLEDLNDNSPVFEKERYSSVVPENSTEGSIISVVKATDLDGMSPNNEFIYRIESGALDKFRINFATGELSVETGARLNREEKDVYIMNISAIDKGTPPRTGRCIVVVKITDVNDEMPRFTPESRTVWIAEKADIGDVLLSYPAVDADLNSNLSYQVVEDGFEAYNDRNEKVDVASNNISSYFNVMPKEGIVFVSGKLDREIAERIVMKLLATDLEAWSPKIQTATATLTVMLNDSNDNAPVFRPSTTYRVNISEGQDIESEALRVEAIDPDKNQKVTYNLDSSSNGYFKIDPQTGIIKIKTKLDRETEPRLAFVVVATDNGNTPMTSSATVSVKVLDINDNAPSFRAHPRVYRVNENASIGTEVGKIETDDLDEGPYGTVFYGLEGVDSDGTFSIDKKEGVIKVSGQLDRETKPEYSLVVVATDNENNPKDQRSNRTTVTIRLDDVNDNAPQFTTFSDRIPDVAESALPDSLVSTIRAVDFDNGKNGTVEYFLTDATNATNSEGKSIFKINKDTGAILVATELKTAIGLRYVTVNVTDKGSPSLHNSSVFYFMIVDMNDDPPTFVVPDPNNPLVVIEEGQPVNTTIITIEATDDDSGVNGQVVYSFKKSPSKPDWKKFNLDRLTGRLSNTEVLDRETQESYELQVRASDMGQTRRYSTDLTMIVQVLDVNDQKPEFDRTKIKTPYDMEVSEESDNECVGNVAIADDKDTNVNFTIICYYIVSAGLNDTFTLTTPGQLCLKRKIDREATPFVFLVIKASSNCYEDVQPKVIPPNVKVPPEFDESDSTLLWVNVSIADINDNPPKFKMKELSLGITKTTQFGSFIYNLKNEVYDVDSKSYGIEKFEMTADVDIQPKELKSELDGQIPFVLFPNGTVKTNTYFRSTMSGYFILSLVVYDKGQKNDTANLRISLINDNQRLKVVLREKAEKVGTFKDLFVNKLQNITDFRIVVDKIQTHENDAGKPEIDKTDMFIHGEDLVTNEVVPAQDLLKAIDYNAEKMVSVFNNYNVITIVPTSIEAQSDEEERKLRMALILVTVILGALVIILLVAFFMSRRKYQRKLKAATAMAYGSQDSDLYKLEMPGTNIHSYENANPIYLEKILLGEIDEDGNNSLDENAIETNPSYDEQEVSMNIFPEEKDQTHVEGTTDLYLKAALKEHETSKNLKNNSDINKNIPNGKIKIKNGHAVKPVEDPEGEPVDDLNTTRNVDGLQTTEI